MILSRILWKPLLLGHHHLVLGAGRDAGGLDLGSDGQVDPPVLLLLE